MRQLKTQNGKLASLPNKGGNQTGKKEYVTDPKQKQQNKKKRKWKSAFGTFFYRSFLVTSETRTNFVLFFYHCWAPVRERCFCFVPVFLFFIFLKRHRSFHRVVLSSTHDFEYFAPHFKKKKSGGKKRLNKWYMWRPIPRHLKQRARKKYIKNL